MNKRTILTLIVVLGLAWSTASVALAQGAGATQNGATASWWVVAGGGAASTGGNVALSETLGQPIAGQSSNGGVAFEVGHWNYSTGGTEAAATTAMLTSSSNPATVGQVVTFDAVVTSAAGTPGGTVTFRDNGAVLAGCTRLPLNGSGQAACATNALAASAHTITAEYNGSAGYDSSTGTLLPDQQVNCTGAIVVANNTDSGPGSLRQAIADLCPSGTITFGGDETITLASSLVISKEMTIDGDNHAVTVSGNDTVRVFQVYTDTHATLDSLTIAHGKTTTADLYGYAPAGGGLKIEPGATVTLTHSTILSNTATYYHSGWNLYQGFGGGICNLGALTVISTTFSGNIAAHETHYSDGGGGAIYNSGTLLVTGSTFSDNGAKWGAGIASEGEETLTVDKSLFSENMSPCGGAGISNEGRTATVSNSTIEDNVAPGSWCEGGAAGISNRFGTMTVTHSIISGNVSEGYYGGLSNYEGTLTVADSAIHDNSANDHGGGIYNWWNATLTVINSDIYSNTAGLSGGGIFNGPDQDASLTLINSTLFANSAQDGGGIFNGSPYSGDSGAVLTVINSTVASNTATISGGGIYNKQATPTLDNTILWDNIAPTGPEIRNTSTGPIIHCSDIKDSGGSDAWNGSLGSDGGGNIDDDPLFVDAPIGNLHLQLSSPAIDAGDNDSVPAGVTNDRDGLPRMLDVPSVPDTGLGDAPIVDMGAYEIGLDLALQKTVTPTEGVPYHSVVTYTLLLESSGVLSDTVLLTDALPPGVTFGGWIDQPEGGIRQGDTVTWTGTVADGESITVVFTATHSGDYGDTIVNLANMHGTSLTGGAEATFSVERGYGLTVQKDGTGSGTVELDPPGGVYGYGTVVSLTAAADSGSVFAGWSGACSGSSDCVVTMTATQSVTATFDRVEYRIYLPLVRR